MKTCAHCGAAHERARAKYCTDLCQHRAYNERRKADGRLAAYRAQHRDKISAYNRAYWAEHGSPRVLYAETLKAGDLRRRARKAGVETQSVRAVDVFERDQWVCWLCSETIDRLTKWPAPASASIDHVVPLARGGPHTLDNVRAAHLRCNMAKGTKIIEFAA